MYLSDCTDVVFAECRILDNSMRSTTTATFHGGGMALVGSTVTLTNSVIAENYIGYGSGTGEHSAHGGGVSIDGASRLIVQGSMIHDNEARARRGNASPIGAGGGFFVASGAQVDVAKTVIRGNQAAGQGVTLAQGGAIYNAGTLTLRNAVVAGNQSTTAHSDGIYLHGGSASIVNCTVADNFDVGIRYNAGTVAITNAIIRGHTAFDLRDFPTDGSGFWPAVWYSCIEDDRNDGFQGSLSVDPLFADRTYYHLKSTVGYYAGGYFDGGDWATADADSPLIDRGHPGLDFSREPEPRGSGINIGAYGNTAVASKSLGAQSAPTVVNTGAQLWGRRTVRLAGDVTDSGGELPLVTFEYWPADLAVTSTVSVGYADGVVLADVSGLTPGTDYQYRIVAANSVGAAFSSVEAFSTHPVPSVFYVSTNGNHSAGTSWSTAYRDVPSALSVVESGDTVLLAGQTFVKAVGIADDFVFRIENLTNVVFRGGYAAENDADLPGPRDPEAHSTVLARGTGPEGRILELRELSNVVFAAVTIRDGLWTGETTRRGGGVLLSNCRDILFEECRIVANRIRSTGVVSFYGGGLALTDNSTVTLAGTMIRDNFVGHSFNVGAILACGGGAYVGADCTLTVVRSLIEDNEALGRLVGAMGAGGGIYVEAGGTLVVRESILRNNLATWTGTGRSRGGAIFNAGTLSLRNSLLYGNETRPDSNDDLPPSGGIFFQAGTASVENCTVADNHDVGLHAYGGAIGLTNTIVWGHATADLLGFPEQESVLTGVSHSLFSAPAGMEGVNGCIVDDPLFIGDGNYRLRDGRDGGLPSPAIDAGLTLPWMNGATDLDGNPRVQGSRGNVRRLVDMGAYEADGTTLGTLFILR